VTESTPPVIYFKAPSVIYAAAAAAAFLNVYV